MGLKFVVSVVALPCWVIPLIVSLLAARTKDVEGLTRQLRGFDLDQCLGEDTEGGEPVPWVGEDETGDRGAGRRRIAVSGTRPGAGLRGMGRARLRVVGNPRGVSSRASLAQCRRSGGLEGLASHFDGSVGRLAGTKMINRLRVDLFTSCAKVPREAVSFGPQFVVGLGQRGVVSAVTRWPLAG